MASDRLRLGELLTAASGAVLLVAMFALDWYAFVDPAQRRSIQKLGLTEEAVPSLHSNGWTALPAPRWALVATVLLCAAALVARLRASAPAAARVDLVLLAVAATSAVLMLYRVLDPPGPNELATVEAGAYVGLAATLGAAAGAYLSIRGHGATLGGLWTELEAEARTPGVGVRPAPPPAPAAPDPNAPHSVPPPRARPRDGA
jgi:hypothetical protein